MRRINNIIALTLIMVFCFGTTVYATPKITTIYKDGVYTMPDRHIYVFKNGKMQYGWVNYKDRLYYCHKTKSKKYPKGSATVSDFRIIDDKWFYFNGSGEIVKRDWYITVGNMRKKQFAQTNRRDGSVRYIYKHSRRGNGKYGDGLRYDTKRRKWQDCKWSNGREYWYTRKMKPFLPKEMLDLQK